MFGPSFTFLPRRHCWSLILLHPLHGSFRVQILVSAQHIRTTLQQSPNAGLRCPPLSGSTLTYLLSIHCNKSQAPRNGGTTYQNCWRIRRDVLKTALWPACAKGISRFADTLYVVMPFCGGTSP